jgi:ribA/ribD-fused uncharacterized protein
MSDFVLFWDGPFSQWHPSEFTISDVTYNCCEQYMMAQKALLFNDQESYQKIMNEQRPRYQKQFGREVKNFDKVKWEKECKQIVYEGNYAKFTQNPHLLKVLMETKGREIVEASPFDTIWGIGLGEDDPRALDKSQWKGTNWLGEVITRVREDLITGKFAF